MSKCKTFVAVVLACAGAVGAGTSRAHAAELQWSVTIGTPRWVYPAPVRMQSAPVYGVHPPAVVRGAAVVWPVAYRTPTRWDRDGDGIPNRHDRIYNPRWDRDGDGVPNRYEPRPWRGR
jgi:hypothetical protein